MGDNKVVNRNREEERKRERKVGSIEALGVNFDTINIT